MKIELKQIHISNFKGIKDLTIDFAHITNIKAENAKGKSTVFDAFCWVLFGKDSRGNSKFHIRPINVAGQDVDFIEISISITLLVDGIETVLKKVQNQKWSKKNGFDNQVFQGNENKYEWNGFPKSEADYNTSIADIITDTLFMMVTNPAYFPGMKWKDQREALVKLVSEIQDADVIASNPKFKSLEDLIKVNNIDAWKEKYAKALKEYNKQIEGIPGRIDEASRNIKEVDYSVEEATLCGLKEQLQSIEVQMEDASKGFEEVEKLNQELFNLKSKIQQIENDARQAHSNGLSDLKSQKDQLETEFNNEFLKDSNLKKTILSYKEEVKQSLNELEATREKFRTIEKEAITEELLACPTCGQAYPEEKAATMQEDFLKSKDSRLKVIRENGLRLNQRIQELNAEIMKKESEQKEVIERKTIIVGQTNTVTCHISEYPKLDFVSIPEWVDLGAKVKDMEYFLSKMDGGKDLTTVLKDKKNEIQMQIDEVNKVLNSKQVIQDAINRVEELKQEQRDLAQKVSDTDKMLFQIEEFTKSKMNMLSQAINSKFQVVNWKLFDTQINGGLKETCELTVKGVPYSDLNSAAKVQAGLDIINTMSEIYGVTAPVFIDNREGVNDIPDVETQIINLIVLQKEIPADTEIIL